MKIKLWLPVLLSGIVIFSCTDLDDINRRLDEYEQRLNALELSVAGVNRDIQSLQQLLDAQSKKIGILSYQPLPDNSGYQLLMSDGSKITLHNGQAGADGEDGLTPTIGVMAHTDGLLYWTLNGEFLCDADGNKVRASGRDGVTPILRVNADGQWEMSIDGGTYWTLVTYEDGTTPVNAVLWFELTETGEGLQITYGDQTFVIPFVKAASIIADKRYLVADGVDLVVLRCVLTNDNRDVTANTTFYADGIELEGNTLQTTEPGEYIVSVKCDNVVAPEIVIKAGTEFTPTPKLYAELYTATWCPFCPPGLRLIEALGEHPQVVAMNMHLSNRNPDPFFHEDAAPPFFDLGGTNMPTIILERNSTKLLNLLAIRDTTAVKVINAHLKTSVPVGIAIKSQWEADDKLRVTLFARATEPLADLKQVVMLSENNLVADQRNNLGDPVLVDYVHHYIFRYVHQDIYGQEITLEADNRLTTELLIDVDPAWKREDLEVTVLITGSDNRVINAQRAKAGGSVGY
ncbi:MAG: PL29 family lyase N-terminal domain-containing protein [Fermentimonas sp.]|jgi:thiol-disulfide isomerase/thioredoxin